MTKIKVAISLDESILNTLDSKVNGTTLRTRSHAIEYYLRKGLDDARIDKAIIMLRADQHKLVLKKTKGVSFLDRQLDFLKKNNIRTIIYATQPSLSVEKIKRMTENKDFVVRVYADQTKNNTQALLLVKQEIQTDVLIVSGDVLNDFDLSAMIKKHFRIGKLVTMGIMSKSQTKTEGSAIVDGDYVVAFKEKSERYMTNIINAGIYIFSPKSINLFEGKQNIEYEIFPKLASIQELVGHFVYGKYEHLR